MNSRRVVFVNRYFYPDHSATSQILSDLAFHLAGRGWDVTVLTSRQLYGDPRAALPPLEVVRGVSIERLRGTRFGRSNLALRAIDYLSFYISAYRAIRKHARSGAIVVAKTDPPLLSVVAARGIEGTPARLVNWIQDLFPEVAEALGTVKRGPLTSLLRRLRNRSINRATINVVIGPNMQGYLAETGARVVLRENWADDRIAPLPHEQNSLRQQWGLTGKFVVGYSGNLGRAHEFETVLGAAAILNANDRVRILIIGSGPQLASVEQFIREHALANVLLQPYQPREWLPESLGAADAHLVTMNPAAEGFIVPSKFYGIAAAGRPSLYVGSSRGDIAEIITATGSGMVIQTGDAAGLARSIETLANDATLASEMGHRARALYEKQFSAQIALEHWERILDEVRGA